MADLNQLILNLIRAYEALTGRSKSKPPGDPKTAMREAYLSLRHLVTRSPFYNPYSKDFPDLEKLVGDYRQLLNASKVPEVLMSWAATPRFHMVLSAAAKRAGDERMKVIEYTISQALIRGIASTGTGSRYKPWKVVRNEDEDDFVEFGLKSKRKGPTLLWEDPRYLDEIELPNGRLIYFDITAARRTLDEFPAADSAIDLY